MFPFISLQNNLTSVWSSPWRLCWSSPSYSLLLLQVRLHTSTCTHARAHTWFLRYWQLFVSAAPAEVEVQPAGEYWSFLNRNRHSSSLWHQHDCDSSTETPVEVSNEQPAAAPGECSFSYRHLKRTQMSP